MSGRYRIRVYGKPRKDIDPALLAQVVILLGRHLHQQRQQQQRRVTARQAQEGDHAGEDVSSADNASPPSESSGQDTLRAVDDSDEGNAGAGAVS